MARSAVAAYSFIWANRIPGGGGVRPTTRGTAPTGPFASSETMRPSLILMIRRAWAAMSASWVTKITVMPDWFKPFEHTENVFGLIGRQIAGGLVCKKDFGRIGQGAGDGHPLLLTPRQLVGFVAHAVRQPHLRQKVPRAFPGRGTANKSWEA
jgi:hypothetical protein